MIWPKPPADNGIGIHIGLDLTENRVRADLERCLYMGIKWVMICHPSPDLLVKTATLFWNNGIMPVLRPWKEVNAPAGFEDVTKRAADALGFSPYIQVYNEPGDDREWRNKKPDDWLEFFIFRWLKQSNVVAMAGGLPGLQILSTRELRAVIQFGFHETAWFCPHNYGCKFPPEYYNRGEGKSIGVLSFLDFADVFQGALGYIPPFICGEGGWFFGEPSYEQHANWTGRLFASFLSGLLPNGQPTPDYLFAICPWILSGRVYEAWYGWGGEATQTIEAVKAMSGFVREDDGEDAPDEETPFNWRVLSGWMEKRKDARVLRDSCQETFGGTWRVRKRRRK